MIHDYYGQPAYDAGKLEVGKTNDFFLATSDDDSNIFFLIPTHYGQ